MSDHNNNLTPNDSIDTVDNVCSPKIFSFSGRIGRLRYLSYLGGVAIPLLILMPIIIALSNPGLLGIILLGLVVIGHIFILVYMIAVTIRRLNDMNRSGWLALLLLAPIVNIVFNFLLIMWPGTKGSNKYGPPPSQNSPGVMALVFLILTLHVAGTLSAIFIPDVRDTLVHSFG